MPARLRFLGGKGGVGKTTLAAAVAVLDAGRGQRTLVVSTDPAHSLGDVLQEGLGEEPREVGTCLWAAEVSGEAHARRRVAQIEADAAEALPPQVRPAVREHLARAVDSPGTVESALLDRLGELIELVPARYDRLVVDSAPTGHMLRLLTMPELLTPWIEGLARQRERARGTDRMLAGLLGRHEEPDPLLVRLHRRRERMAGLRDRLRADAAVHLVVVPERMVWAETLRAVDALDRAGIPLGAPVVNRVLPAGGTGLLEERRAGQQQVLDAVLERFPAAAQVPLQAGEPAGVAGLRGIAELLERAGW
ncbi:TRC40/GET3/ArsA family transport-energizing ATPase [Pseudonocardia sp. KRD-184]|uniref:TRC40/GET3/ArsA family transport-energizing ATPase n=1 Tax=Pseudonocardia oceani TaxID=2792013 RepID=A0ABS6U684_9PSEU|nr:TRC40/GET3/ArsA family transport-energizing ATPase [Pseudonocardia oceani]MBW0090045.1 TRC40/GET3/ArsA family transport-energizing ATPase [Pseudonocardia oceani]MBW0095289.1 TRC40/GET3/ArsA family transport-energizing ATPase [Pseudonocardia oceani]MBW0111424.1 TRC40/GET3/ArsA family transport-energizing ATPase [Pseudonocardia oceani]MBW0121795.1 TRC40/GET3/ArsA family transport-energizing ATPase [Pseudonocardia oceani]MBW0127409.1 TRC40/GET3/ArsA family transport-energizing ATPase [Pseudono